MLKVEIIDHLNLAQIAKSQNIPYCKLYHVYLMLGSIPDAVEVCRKSWEYLEHYRKYLREWKKMPFLICAFFYRFEEVKALINGGFIEFYQEHHKNTVAEEPVGVLKIK